MKKRSDKKVQKIPLSTRLETDFSKRKDALPSLNREGFEEGFRAGAAACSEHIVLLLKTLITAKSLVAPSDVNEVDLYMTVAALVLIDEIEGESNEFKKSNTEYN